MQWLCSQEWSQRRTPCCTGPPVPWGAGCCINFVTPDHNYPPGSRFWVVRVKALLPHLFEHGWITIRPQGWGDTLAFGPWSRAYFSSGSGLKMVSWVTRATWVAGSSGGTICAYSLEQFSHMVSENHPKLGLELVWSTLNWAQGATTLTCSKDCRCLQQYTIRAARDLPTFSPQWEVSPSCEPFPEVTEVGCLTSLSILPPWESVLHRVSITFLLYSHLNTLVKLCLFTALVLYLWRSVGKQELGISSQLSCWHH